MFLFQIMFVGWLACILLSSVTSVLGSFVVWRGMSFFGDALAHGSLLGVFVAFFFGLEIHLGLLITVFVLTFCLVLLQKFTALSYDTMLGIVGNISFALGIVLISALIINFNIDIEEYLFGNLLAIDWSDIVLLSIMVIVVLTIFVFKWKKFLSIAISPEIAKVDGINVDWLNIVFTAMIAVVIALSIKIVGALIISSFLIIPPAIAHNFKLSPLKSIIVAFIAAAFAATIGSLFSVLANIPFGPAIVVVLGFLFVLSVLVTYRLRK